MRTVSASYVGGLMSLGVASCCILPVTLMLIGVGGSGLALFGRIASAAVYVLPASTLMLALAWAVAWRRGTLRRLGRSLSGSTLLTTTAWVIFTFEQPVNNFLIGFF